MEDATNFAERYQSVLVPVIFEPWAMELIARAEPRPGEQVLDLACGTGVVTRAVAAQVPGIGGLAAVDHSPEMLGVARILASEAGVEAEWVETDAAALPFDDGRFDLAFCQQALQFFPDRPAALRELRRVLKPMGRAVFCVQRALDINPMLRAQFAALDAHVGQEAGAAVRAICSLPNSAELGNLFESAGFNQVEVESVTLNLHHPDARAFATGAMGGMHTGDKLAGLGVSGIARVVDAFVAELGACFDGRAMRFPHVSNVVVARA